MAKHNINNTVYTNPKGELMKIIIGLAGVKTSGKSTVANIIKNKFDVTILESALADKLKNVSGEIFNVPREYFDRQDLKEVPLDKPRTLDVPTIEQVLNAFGVSLNEELLLKYIERKVVNMTLDTPRKIAQIIGTEVLRAAGDEDIHCKNVPLNNNGVTVISDLRFPNEFNYFNNLKDALFIPLYIQRDEAEKYVTKDSHPSETSVFLFSNKCIKIDNNSNLAQLEERIGEVLSTTVANITAQEDLFGYK